MALQILLQLLHLLAPLQLLHLIAPLQLLHQYYHQPPHLPLHHQLFHQLLLLSVAGRTRMKAEWADHRDNGTPNPPTTPPPNSPPTTPPPVLPPTTPPPTPPPTVSPTAAPLSCGSNEKGLVIEVLTDNYSGETNREVKNVCSGQTVQQK